MWEPELPDVADHLRQGDLLVEQPMPKTGKIQLTAAGLTAEVFAPGLALVLERCCTVEQRKTVMLARVNIRPFDPESPDAERALAGLRAIDHHSGAPYAKYQHLLDPLSPHMEELENHLWVARLTERVSIAAKDHDQLEDLRRRRVGRMTPLARAHLRGRLVVHFGDPEKDDLQWLADNGYDSIGRPLQT